MICKAAFVMFCQAESSIITGITIICILTLRYKHSFKFAKHVSDDQHPSSVANTSEPLVGVIQIDV